MTPADTRAIDRAICPWCRGAFNPQNHKMSEWGLEYRMRCPNCDESIEVFESIEYQCSAVEND